MLRKIRPQYIPSICFKKRASFSSFPQLQTYITEIIRDEKLSEERNELDRFAKKFSAIQQFYEKIELERSNLNKKYLNLSLNSKHPLRDILQNHTIKNRRGFSEDLLALSLDYLAKTFKSFGKTVENFEDYSIIDLHQNSRFIDITEDVKFALKPGVYSSFENLSKIAESLYKLEYKDLDIQNLMFEKIIRFLKKENEEFIMNLENPFDNFQAIKKYYYENIMDIDEISNNEKFLQKLDKIINLEDRLDNPQTVKLEKVEIPNNESEASDDMIPLLLTSLSNLLSSRQFSIRTLIQTISSIRSYYLKMRKITENNLNISKNSNAQARILILEERLIEMGVLNVDDVKYIEKMEEEEENTRRVGEIVVNLLKSEVEQEDQFFIKNLIENDLKQISQKKETKKIDFYAEELRLKGEYMGHLLIYLGEIAKLPFRELKKRDFVEEKWKNLLDKPLPKEVKETLLVNNIENRAFEIDPIYSPIYLSTVKNFQEIFPLLKERASEINTLEGLSKISLAYSNLGLSEESNFFISKITESALPEINSFSMQDFKHLLRSINQSYEKNDLVENFVFNFVQANCLDFDLETAIRSLLILSYSKNDGASLKKLMTCALDRLEDEFQVYQTEGDLKQLMFDFRMLIESDLLGFKELSSKRNLNFYFSGIENFEFDDASNIALNNPMIKEFMSLLQEKYPYLNDFSSFHQKTFAYFNQLYHPQFFCSRFDEKTSQFKKKAVFLLPTGHHSIKTDQSKIPLIWQVRFSIIEKMFPNIECDFIPTLKLFNVDFAKGKVTLKSIGESAEWIVKKLILENRAPFLEKLHLFCEGYIVFYKSIVEEISKKANEKAIFLKIFTHCVNIATFLTKLSQQETETLTSFYLASIKYDLYQIHTLSQKLSPSFSNMLFEFLSKIINLPNNENLIQNLNNVIFANIKEQYQNDISEKGTRDLWLGRRLSSALIPTAEHKKDISYEMVNLFFYSDHRYHQYPYWESLTKDFTFNNLSFFKSKTYNNDMPLASIDLDHQPNLGIVPSPGKVRNIIRPMSYIWHWEDSFYQRISGEEGNQGFEALAHQTQEPFSETVAVILSLQNLKYVAKKDFKVEDIAGMLPKLDFIEDLMREHMGESQVTNDHKPTKIIPRNSKDLLTFLENPISGNFTNNYISFMMEKFDEKQELTTLLKIKNNQKELLKQIKNGELSLQAYVDLQDSLCKAISQKLQDIKDKNLDQNVVSNLTKKFVDYEFDREELFSNVRLQRFDKYEDIDFVLSEDSPDKFLSLKKRRAESNLIKLRLIKKISDGENLSQTEQQYLKFWKNNSEKGTIDRIDQEPTERKVGVISEKDKNIFKSFNYVDVEVMNDFPLSDLILEFSMLFNEKLVQTIDLHMKGSYFKKDWDLNVSNLSPSFPQQESNWLTTLIENRLWESSSKITENETEVINRMMSLMRKSSPKEAKYVQGIAKITKDFVDTVNPFFNRYALFAKWLDVKEQEIKARKDTFLAKGTKEKEFERLQAVWKNVFKSEYNETPARSLHLFAVGLSERMHLIKKFMPFSLPTILKYFFIHPNTRATDKELVVAYLQMFNIETNYDCDDMSIILKKLHENNVYFLTERNYEEKMRKASAPFVGDLIEKINKI